MRTVSEPACEVLRACRLGLGGIVQLWCRGRDAERRVHRRLRTRRGTPVSPPRQGAVQYGLFCAGETRLDEVLVAWTGGGAEINCHGGTGASQAVLRLLHTDGFTEVGEADWHLGSLRCGSLSPIACEAALRWPEAHTARQVEVLATAGELDAAFAEWQTAVTASPAAWATVGAGIARALERAPWNAAALRCHRVALVGAPNVGKSTCLNALVGRERALVSSAAGTTRDAVRHRTEVDGLAVELVDTAGQLEGAQGVDARAVDQAAGVIGDAALAVLLLDGSRALNPADRRAQQACAGRPCITVLNKTDCEPRLSAAALAAAGLAPGLRLSAQQGLGLDALRSSIAAALLPEVEDACGRTPAPFTRRQTECLEAAAAALARGAADAATGALERCARPRTPVVRDAVAAAIEAEWKARKEDHERPSA